MEMKTKRVQQQICFVAGNIYRKGQKYSRDLESLVEVICEFINLKKVGRSSVYLLGSDVLRGAEVKNL